MARAQAAVFAAFLALGLARAAPSLSWPMVYDDLHLIRTYSAAELRGAWHGHWDPDGIETAGFRPLSLLFNHVRASVLGENVAAHRVLVLVLYALYAALLVPLAARFGAGAWTVLLAGVVMLVAWHGMYHFVWITDGNHVLQGLAFAGSALLLLGGLDRRDPVRLVLSLGCLAAGLLVREDTLAVVPVVMGLGLVHARRRGPAWPREALAWAAALVTLCAALLAYRALAVPQAEALRFDLRSMAVAVAHAANPAGREGFDGAGRLATVTGWVALVILLASLARFRSQVDWRGPVLWLAAAVVSCTPALTFQRDDLLFFPGTFMALFFATATVALARRKGPAGVLAALATAAIIAAAGWTGRVFAENFHPDSTRALWWNMQILLGDFADRATVPPARRQEAMARLEQLGIRAGAHPRQRVRELASAARAEGRRRPSADGAVFVPLLPERF